MYPFNIKVVRSQKIQTATSMEVHKLRVQNNKKAGLLFTEKFTSVSYRGVALSTLRGTKLTVSNIYDPVYVSHFERRSKDLAPWQFLRSTAINITMMDGAVYKPGRSPVRINFRVNTFVPSAPYDKVKPSVI